jgi:hypothetical protein
MTNTKKLSLITTLAAAAAFPTLAAAHPRDSSQWTRLGEVGTHVHDAEDYVPVSCPEPLARLELRAEGQTPVRLDGVKVQFTDGRIQEIPVRAAVMPGERIQLDVPSAGLPVKMLVLDYGNRGPFWRDLETAHVEVLGLTAPRHQRYDDRYGSGYRDDRGGYGYRDRSDVAPTVDRRSDYRAYDDAPATYVAPVYVPARPSAGVRFEWRGGVQVRVR